MTESIDQLSSISYQLKESLTGTPYDLFVLIVEIAQKNNRLSFSKSDLLSALKQNEGEVKPANFRKRISNLNKALKKEKLKLVIQSRINTINLKFDEDWLKIIIEKNNMKRTKQFLVQRCKAQIAEWFK